MSWFKVDDRMAFHKKMVSAGNESVGAWVRAGAWSAGAGTDGLIPAAMARTISRKPSVWERLIGAGLVDRQGEDFFIHDYLEWNPSAAEVAESRAVLTQLRSEAGRLGGVRSGQSRREANEANAKQTLKQTGSNGASKREAPIPYPYPEEKNPLTPVAKPGERDERVVCVYEHYIAAKKRHNAKARTSALTAKDRKSLLERFAEGFSADDMKLAIDGLFLDPFYLGENDRGTKYLEFMYVLRHVQKFIDRAEAAPKDPNRPGFIDGLPILRLPDRDKHIPKPGEGIDATGLFPAEEA